MGAPTPLVLLPLWCSYPLGCSYPLVLLRWVLLPLGCSYPIGCSYPLRFVFVLVDVSLLMGGITPSLGQLWLLHARRPSFIEQRHTFAETQPATSTCRICIHGLEKRRGGREPERPAGSTLGRVRETQ